MNVNRDMTKGARFSFYGFQFLMGCGFWISAALGYFSMSEVVYGAAVAWRAELWAAAMAGPATVYLVALIINGNAPWTPYVRALVGVWMMLYYTAFVVLGFPTAGIDLIVIASSCFAIKAFVMLCCDTRDILRGRHARK